MVGSLNGDGEEADKLLLGFTEKHKAQGCDFDGVDNRLGLAFSRFN